MPESMPSDDLESWTDRTAHQEWLEIRHGVTQTEFALPENVRHDAVARLHKIICRGTDSTVPTSHETDRNAIAAVLALAKLATATTTTVARRAEMLSKHVSHQGPLATDPHSVRLRKILNRIEES